MAHKSSFKDFCEKVSQTLFGNNFGKDYDCLCDLDLDFEKALTSLNFKVCLSE